MLLDQLSLCSPDYAHINAILSGSYETILNTNNALILYSNISHVYAVETTNICESLLQKLYQLSPRLLETTNETLFQQLSCQNQLPFEHKYKCLQFTFPDIAEKDSHLEPLHSADLPYVIDTYESEAYIRQLFSHNRLMGYYVNSVLIGYIAHHIDGSIGALYVKPEYRNKGYASAIVKAALSAFADSPLFSQVIEDNTASIRLHEALHAAKSDVKICWLYDDGFSF
ncbi:MAG: GNAT family N-acetyltransferase [Lachnospiraceae bacterium]|nr:GNAT family N-acetyltransferase [Lachnospiraceae bacterium]